MDLCRRSCKGREGATICCQIFSVLDDEGVDHVDEDVKTYLLKDLELRTLEA